MGTLRQPPHRRHAVRMEEDAGALRRAVGAVAARLPAVRAGEAELVATELATNIIRHTASGGHVLYREAGGGIELIAVDHGPGSRAAGTPPWAAPAPDEPPQPHGPPSGRPSPGGPPHWPSRGELSRVPPRGGGLGVGVAGVRRFASFFDCYSEPGGTVVLVRLGPSPPTADGHWRWGGVNVPVDDTGESGDAWAVTAARGRLAALVVDGLGHGPAAAVAARAAVSTFEQWPATDLDGFVRQANQAMRGTRGGVAGVGVIEERSDELRFAGVGNISGRVVLGGRSHGLIGRHGTLGVHLEPPRAHMTAHSWGAGAALILTSDGISGRCDPSAYPALPLRDPAIAAAVLHRDHGRGTDDATVLVVQDTRGHDMPGGDVQGR